MAFLQQGGYPKVIRAAVTSNGQTHTLGGMSSYLQVTASAACQLFFSEQDYDLNQNWIDLGATTPFEGPVAVRQIWLKGAASVVAVAYLRV